MFRINRHRRKSPAGSVGNSCTLAVGSLADSQENYLFEYRPQEDLVEWSLGKRTLRMSSQDLIDLAGTFYSVSSWVIGYKMREAAKTAPGGNSIKEPTDGKYAGPQGLS